MLNITVLITERIKQTKKTYGEVHFVFDQKEEEEEEMQNFHIDGPREGNFHEQQ